jgi:cytidylate kinase
MRERKRRIAERYDIEKDKIEDFIRKTDKRRSNYYEYYTDRKWGMANNYDLCLNSSVVGIEGAVELISKFVEMKEERLRAEQV